MDNSITTSEAGHVRGRIRSRRHVISAVCVTALGLGALVATGPVEAVPALAATTPPPTPTPDPVTTVEQLRAAVVNNGGVINIAPGTYSLTSQLEIRRSGTQLRAVDPANTILAYTGGASTPKSRVLEVWATGVVVDGLKITGGNKPIDDGGGGVEVESGASLTLSRSWVTGNVDDLGGGILNEGTLAIVDSTISGNTASIKGGGLLNDGTATISNSTIEGNTSYWGSAIASFSTINIGHSTIVRNVTTTTSNSYGALQRLGGAFSVRYSIVGDNVRTNGTAARNCAGTVTLRVLNVTNSTTGCSTSGIVLVGGPLVGPLQDNGGPTPTAAPLDFSKSLDAIGVSGSTCSSGATADQRGVPRPSGAGCEVGSYEMAPLGVSAGLSVDTISYEPLDTGVVEVGSTSVPSNLIAGELAARSTINEDGTLNASGLRSIGLRSIGLRSITLDDIGLRSIDPASTGLRSTEVKANGLRSIALGSIGLRSIGLRSIGLRSIGLRSIGLRSIPLSEIPLLQDGGWSALLVGTDFENVPVQSITLEDISAVTGVVPDGLTLESIDLSSTGLRSIGLRSILLSGIGLRSIPLPLEVGESVDDDGGYSTAWCTTLFGTDLCKDPLAVQDVGDAELWEMQLAGGNIDQEKILKVPLSGLTSIGLRSIGLRSIGLRSIFLENTGLRSIGLRSIGLRSIDTDGDGIEDTGIESIVRCTTGSPDDPCRTDLSNTLTLGDIAAGCLPADVLDQGFADPASCLLREHANVGLLLDLLGAPDEFGVTLLDGLTLYDILFAFVPPEDIPWEVVDLGGASLQNIADPAQPTFDYVVDVAVTNGPATVTVDLLLPQGFAIAAGKNSEDTTWCLADACTAVPPTTPLELANPVFEIADVESGPYRLVVPVRAGATTGPSDQFQAIATVTAVGANGAPPSIVTDPVGVKVVQAIERPNRPAAPALSDGELQLGYVGGTDEIDAYSFTAPDDTTGASARVLLSNIPDSVDYDLTVYGPRPTSLRGDPNTELSSLGDVEFDLDPDDDVLPTDVVNDIAVDINAIKTNISGLEDAIGEYALRDVSSRRSNNDEEVTLPALVGGETYVVVVSGYFGDLSPEPYGLRVRLDRRTALPECANDSYPGTSTPSQVPTNLIPVDGTNTLYVTNGARLESESPGRLSDVVDAIVATDGVNGVEAGLLYVDDVGQWDGWNDSCSPEARNAVVKAIGDRIDAAPGTIENIVIVGGDGVIPMAAVPDLTKYSNESTFAREVLSPTAAGLRSNAVAGTVGSGYLLSDDPYATDAGISVQNGDHELYVPDRNIGRLVETADEIIDQLENFTTYSGLLDPSTFQAMVTGYDFLDDGAQAIADELGAGFTVDQLTDSPSWNKDTYLELFRPGGDGATPATFTPKDYSVFAPNAHYDFESLLPAAADAAGFFTENQLVTTADFALDPSDPIDPTQALVPAGALGFTVGCHAGLSVSDVQLGFASTDPRLDWAQLYSRNATQWIGHTTYGYGDTVIVAYSERLAQIFAGNVAALAAGDAGAPSSLGAAVRDAKQRYLAGTLVLSPYDEKILQSWTYYGLPMYSIGSPPAALTPSTSFAVEETATAETAPIEETTTTGDPQGLLLPRLRSAVVTEGPVTFGDADPDDGRVPVSIDLRGDGLREVPTPDGSYWMANSITVAQYRPVQPLVDVAIPIAGPFAGFLITHLTSQDLPDSYVPFYARPIVDNGVDEGRIVAGDGAFPATLQRIPDQGASQRLLVAAGQYESGQRLFREISGELLPRTDLSDTDAPRFLDVVGTNIPNVGSSGRGIQFDVRTDDGVGGTNARVVIIYREPGEDQWRTLELSKRTDANGVATWFGTVPLKSTDPDLLAEFFAQSVDAAGNVGITSNKIENFLAVNSLELPPGTGPAIVYAGPPENAVDGQYFSSGAPFEITPTGSVFSVDSGPGLPYNLETGIIVKSSDSASSPGYDADTGVLTIDAGPHVLLAEDDNGLRTSRFFILDSDGPSISFSDIAGWTNASVIDLQVSSNDGSGVGIATLEVCVVDAVEPCATGTDVAMDGLFQATAPAITADEGQVVRESVVATAKDLLGNTTVDTREVKIDRAAPVVTVTKSPVTAWANGDVTVTVNAADIGSGLDTICITKDTGNDCEPVAVDELDANGNYSFVIDTDSQTIITATATDNAGNETTSDPTTVQRDTRAPVITLTVPNNGDWQQGPVDVLFNVTDERSGVATVIYDTGNGPQTASIDTDGNYLVEGIDVTGDGTATITVNATDNAGNQADETSADIVIDNQAPTITFTNVPTTEWVNGNVTVTVTADDDEGSGVAELCVDNLACTTSPVDVNVNTLDSPTGVTTQTITATATDNAGNTTDEQSVIVNVDNAAPVVTVTKSPVTAWANGDVTVTVNAADIGSGLDTICITKDTGNDCEPVAVDELDANGNYSFVIDTDSQTIITATATDNAGNETTSDPTTVRIDTVNPTASLSVPADANGDGIYNFGEAATATFACGDVGSDVAKCELLDGDAVVATNSATPHTINTSIAGTKTLTVRATDAAGNTFTSPAKTLTIGFNTCVLSTSSQSKVLPIYTMRLRLCDENGVNKSASNITLTALAIDSTRDPIFNFSGLPLNYRFKYVSSGKYYEYTFYTGGLARNVDHTLSFTTQPVPSRSIGIGELNKLATNTATFRLR